MNSNLTSSELNSSDSEFYSSNSEDNDNEYNLHNLRGDILNKYNIIEEIGSGGYSIVWLGYNIENGKYYAIKVQNSDDFDEGMEEVKILKKLKHKNIIKLIEYFIEERHDDENILRKYICYIYELCCGNLDAIARKGNYNKGYPQDIVLKFYNQIKDGINYLHNDVKIFHGDIKPDNILLSGINNRDKKIIDLYNSQNFNKKYSEIKKKYWIEKGGKLSNIKKMKSNIKLKIRKSIHKRIIEEISQTEYYKSDEFNKDKYILDKEYIDNPEIIISDFGNYCPDEEKFNESFGTLYYQAPEIILENDYTKKVDIWALGCTLYEFLKGNILFNPKKNNKQSITENHLMLIINTCGHFDENFLKSCKRTKYFFNKKMRLKNNINVKSTTINNFLNEELNMTNKDFWIDILSKMLKLTPAKRDI
jgi:serine/threonine protein kinase